MKLVVRICKAGAVICNYILHRQSCFVSPEMKILNKEPVVLLKSFRNIVNFGICSMMLVCLNVRPKGLIKIPNIYPVSRIT